MIRVPQFLLGFVMAHMVFVAHAAPSCILPEKAESGYDYNTNRDSYGKNDSATTDYYKLAINWSGAHCAEKAKEIENLKKKGKFEAAETVRNRNAFQCFSNNKFGWILHGLWAQTCNGKTGKTAGTGRQSRPIHGYAEATFLLSITRRSKATYANPRGRRSCRESGKNTEHVTSHRRRNTSRDKASFSQTFPYPKAGYQTRSCSSGSRKRIPLLRTRRSRSTATSSTSATT
ncbi:hypothetical protein P4M26_26660 [Pseudomonas aeruginosa]|nr:hypothetical protein [Pseudomonas aeruginosa]